MKSFLYNIGFVFFATFALFVVPIGFFIFFYEPMPVVGSPPIAPKGYIVLTRSENNGSLNYVIVPCSQLEVYGGDVFFICFDGLRIPFKVEESANQILSEIEKE